MSTTIDAVQIRTKKENAPASAGTLARAEVTMVRHAIRTFVSNITLRLMRVKNDVKLLWNFLKAICAANAGDLTVTLTENPQALYEGIEPAEMSTKMTLPDFQTVLKFMPVVFQGYTMIITAAVDL